MIRPPSVNLHQDAEGKKGGSDPALFLISSNKMEEGKKICGNLTIKLFYCIPEITLCARSCMPCDDYSSPPLSRKLL
jgi:hypothetical protein